MTTIQGFTPPPNHATMGVESTILDNLTPAPSDMSGQGEPDMSAKLKQRAVINGKIFWLTGSTQQELFQSYLSHAITEGVVVPPDENGQHRKDGLIPSNPSKSKRLRNPSKKKSTRLPLTTKEAEDIEAHLPDIPKLLDRRYVALLLYCPARSEDIRGIRMKDIDPYKMLIRIERSVTYAKAKTIIGDPKTEAGFRHMLMLPKLWDVLALTPEEMHDPDAYLLHMRDDTHQPLTFQANRRLWERVCAAINVYGKTPHCFRHTFATRAYRAGVSEKTLQSMGGWADLKTMQNVYIHTQEEDLENARRLLTLL